MLTCFAGQHCILGPIVGQDYMLGSEAEQGF